MILRLQMAVLTLSMEVLAMQTSSLIMDQRIKTYQRMRSVQI